MQSLSNRMRKWATPLTVGSFLVMGVTGTLMFFHLDSGLNKTVHEWAGWAMLLGVGAHLAINWRAFMGYFKRPVALGVMGAGALALAISFVPLGQGSGSPVPLVMGALFDAPIEQVIALGRMSEAEGIAALATAGVIIAPGQSLAEATRGERDTEIRALRALLDG